MTDIWAVIPLKDTSLSKQRLSGAYPQDVRQRLAIAMFADTLEALTESSGLAGILVVTEDLEATRIATHHHARITTQGARDGHTGAIAAAAHLLAAERRGGMLALPADIPLLTPRDIATILAAHPSGCTPGCTLVPAHDGRGTNAVLLTPPDAMQLKFGGESFGPHRAAATRLDLHPTVLSIPNIALDIDEPEDVLRLQASGSFLTKRTKKLLLALRGGS